MNELMMLTVLLIFTQDRTAKEDSRAHQCAPVKHWSKSNRQIKPYAY